MIIIKPLQEHTWIEIFGYCIALSGFAGMPSLAPFLTVYPPNPSIYANLFHDLRSQSLISQGTFEQIPVMRASSHQLQCPPCCT